MPTSANNAATKADQVLVLANPKAGARPGRPQVDVLVGLLGEKGLRGEVITDAEELAERSRELLVAGRLRAVVAAGGDGTAALAINQTPIGAPIAVLPLGTENLLAKYLRIARPADVCQTIEDGVVMPFDVGQANDRLFLLMLSCGFDADVVRRLHEGRRGHIRHLTYAKPILDSLRTYPYPEIRVTRRPESAEAETPSDAVTSARWVFVMNLPCYARGLPIIPEANGWDGALDVCTFRDGSLLNGLRYLGGVLLGRHRQGRGCTSYRATRLRLEAEEPTPFQIDGDPGGMLPVEIGLLPGRMSLLVPRAWAAKAIPCKTNP